MQKGTSNAPPTKAADPYGARLDAHVKDQDPIAMQRAAPQTLASLIEGAEDELLSRRPEPGKWSVRAILAHLA